MASKTKGRVKTTNPGGSGRRNLQSEKGDARRVQRADHQKARKGPGEPVSQEELVRRTSASGRSRKTDKTPPRVDASARPPTPRGRRRSIDEPSPTPRRYSKLEGGARPLTNRHSGQRRGTRTVKGADARGGTGKAGPR